MSPREKPEEGPQSGVSVSATLPYRSSLLTELQRNKEGEVKNTYGNLCILLRHTFGEALTFDEMALRPCLHGKPLSDTQFGEIRERFERVHQVAFGKEAIDQAIPQIASERSFHPVRRYLDALPTWDGVDRIDRVVTEILGARDTVLNAAYLRCFFIASVVRALKPGEKVDNCLVLFGPQGARKSTFFEVLGCDWYSNTHFDIKVRQAYLTLAAAWIYELAEIESIVGTKEDPDVKRLFSSAEDTFVPPYGKAAIKHRRTTMLVGTTNKQQFLKDHTGNRRYHVIATGSRINIEKLREWRDQLWAEAYMLELEGKTWWLSPERELEQAHENEEFEQHDPWFEPIAEWLTKDWARKIAMDPTESLTTANILGAAIDMTGGSMDRAAENRVGAIMHRLGYTSKQRVVYYNNQRQRKRVWEREENENEMSRSNPVIDY